MAKNVSSHMAQRAVSLIFQYKYYIKMKTISHSMYLHKINIRKQQGVKFAIETRAYIILFFSGRRGASVLTCSGRLADYWRLQRNRVQLDARIENCCRMFARQSCQANQILTALGCLKANKSK